MPSGITVMRAAPGGSLEVTSLDLATALEQPGWVWVDVVQEDLRDLGDLPATLGLHRLDLEDIGLPTELPRTERRDSYAFLVAYTPSADEQRLRMVEVDIVLADRVLATFRREASRGVGAVISLAQRQPMTGPDQAFSTLTDLFARRTLPLIDGLDREIDALEESAIVGDPSVPLRVQALRRDTTRLRSLVVRQRDAYRDLHREAGGLMSLDALHGLAGAHGDYAQLADSLDTARSLLGSVLDTYRATVAERMNDVMKVLTVFSAIVLPLGLIAGIYGMNFVNMPELEWRWAYFAVLSFMALTAIGLWTYFARRGFIGGPKLPRVDRVVGKGLGAFAHLTLAPIRFIIDTATPGDTTTPTDTSDLAGDA